MRWWMTLAAVAFAIAAAWAAGWLDWVWPIILAAGGADAARRARQPASTPDDKDEDDYDRPDPTDAEHDQDLAGAADDDIDPGIWQSLHRRGSADDV